MMRSVFSIVPKRTTHFLFALIMLLLSSGVLFFLVYRERELILHYEWQFRWERLLFSLALFEFALVLAALVWADIMRVLGSPRGWMEHLRIYSISQMASRLPGTVWYLASRGYFYREEQGGMRRVATASSLELVITIVSGFIVVLLANLQGAILRFEIPYPYLLIVLILGTFLLHPRVIRWAMHRTGFRQEVPDLRYMVILRWLLGYMVIWISGGVIFYATATAITAVDLLWLPFFVGIWSLVGASSLFLLFLPSNLGFTEVGLSMFLAMILPSSLAVSITVFTRLVHYLYQVIGVGLLVLGTFGLERSGANIRRSSPTI